MLPFSNLKNKRVLVTRPRHQAKEVIARLRKAGAKVIHIPLIEIADPSDNFKSLDRAISHLDKYDWLIFTSQNAVSKFFDRFRRLLPLDGGGGVGVIVRGKFAAVGPATAAVLKRHGIRKVIIPRKNNYSADGLVEILRRYEFRGKRVLFPSAKKARETLPSWLKKQGAKLNKVEAYQTVMPRNIDKNRLRKLIAEKRIDKIYFFSRSAKHNFLKIVERKTIATHGFLKRPF